MENGGFITKFDDILQIKGINKKTVNDLRKFCESHIQDDGRVSAYVDSQLIQENNNFNQNIQPKSFVNINSTFTLYDEDPLVNASAQATKSIQPLSSTDNLTKKWKSLKLILEPKLIKYNSVRSFTSIYQDATGVTCTQFSANGEWINGVKINDWNYHKVESVGTKHVFQLFEQLSQVVDRLPKSDIYIMDDHIKMQHFRKAVTPKRIAEIVQMSQQFAILATLLRSRKPHDSASATQSNVFTMSYSIVARLYDLFIGREPISTKNVIRKVLHASNKYIDESPDSLVIELNDNIKNIYFKSYPVERECLGKSMLMGLTFIRLGLLKTNK